MKITPKLFTESEAIASLYPRPENSNKSTFGKTALFVGSKKYPGAAYLATSAALRTGVGYLIFHGSEELCLELRSSYPEVIYKTDLGESLLLSELLSPSSVLLGCGSDISEMLAALSFSLASAREGITVLDADALNSISKYGSKLGSKYGSLSRLSTPDKRVIITPHPLELSRLTGLSVETIEKDRVKTALAVSRELGVTLLLKGNRTLITDGSRLYENTTGSSALARAGSGDVLAGLIAGFAANVTDPLIAAALGAYIHGAAADLLAKERSSYGTLPSELPLAASSVIRSLETAQKNKQNPLSNK